MAALLFMFLVGAAVGVFVMGEVMLHIMNSNGM